MQVVREPQLDSFVKTAESFANEAINDGFAATFAYWVSALSDRPAVEGMTPPEPNWQRRIGAARPRPLDAGGHYKLPAGVYNDASELTQQRLVDALNPQPLVLDASPNRLPLELIANLDWQTRQRRQRSKLVKPQPQRRSNPSRLYDVLQAMGIEDQQPLM